MNTRLQQFLAAENMSQAQFADSINVARAGVSHIIGGRNKPSYEFIINTMKRYPELNIEWLLTGKGKMYGNSQSAPAAPLPAVAKEEPVVELPLDTGLFSSLEEDTIYKSLKEEAKDSPVVSETTEEHEKVTVRQRKATKIIIFYDDGTFQEF